MPQRGNLISLFNYALDFHMRRTFKPKGAKENALYKKIFEIRLLTKDKFYRESGALASVYGRHLLKKEYALNGSNIEYFFFHSTPNEIFVVSVVKPQKLPAKGIDSILKLLANFKNPERNPVTLVAASTKLFKQKTDAYYFLQLGLRQIELKKIAQGIVKIKKAIKIQPRYLTAYLSLADAYRLKNELDQSVRIYKKTIALFPKKALPRLGIAGVLTTQEKYYEAIKQVNQVLRVDEKHVRAHHVRMYLAYKIGFYDDVKIHGAFLLKAFRKDSAEYQSVKALLAEVER